MAWFKVHGFGPRSRFAHQGKVYGLPRVSRGWADWSGNQQPPQLWTCPQCYSVAGRPL